MKRAMAVAIIAGLLPSGASARTHVRGLEVNGSHTVLVRRLSLLAHNSSTVAPSPLLVRTMDGGRPLNINLIIGDAREARDPNWPSVVGDGQSAVLTFGNPDESRIHVIVSETSLIEPAKLIVRWFPDWSRWIGYEAYSSDSRVLLVRATNELGPPELHAAGDLYGMGLVVPAVRHNDGYVNYAHALQHLLDRDGPRYAITDLTPSSLERFLADIGTHAIAAHIFPKRIVAIRNLALELMHRTTERWKTELHPPPSEDQDEYIALTIEAERIRKDLYQTWDDFSDDVAEGIAAERTPDKVKNYLKEFFMSMQSGEFPVIQMSNDPFPYENPPAILVNTRDALKQILSGEAPRLREHGQRILGEELANLAHLPNASLGLRAMSEDESGDLARRIVEEMTRPRPSVERLVTELHQKDIARRRKTSSIRAHFSHPQ